MTINSFKIQVNEAIKCTKEGLDLLVELSELQESIKSLPIGEDLKQIVKEIIEKEKMAVSLIQKGTLMQRGLIKTQHEAIERLINRLA